MTVTTPGESTTVHLIGNLLTFRARGRDTEGRFSLVDCLTAPGQGTPPHIQEDAEAFYVLDGTYQITVGATLRTCTAGSFAYVQPGEVHAFHNVGDAPARMLILNLPSGMHEGFFAEAGDAVEPGTTVFPPPGAPDMGRLLAAAAKYHLEILPPPGHGHEP